MDDLTFRRTLYADPYSNDPDVINAAKHDPKKQAFWDELRAFENELHHACKVDVPDNLADKLLLKQSIDIESEKKARRPWYLSIAAAIVICATLGIFLVIPGRGSITDYALAHASHMESELLKYGPTDSASLNAKLATLNTTLSDGIADILSANFCYLGHAKSLHMIMQGKHGLVSLFLLPEDDHIDGTQTFNDERLSGQTFQFNSHRVIVVGDERESLDSISQKVNTMFSTSV